MFGELNYHPPNGFKFFEILEHVLEHKFQQFPPKEIIDLLLSFIYIERCVKFTCMALPYIV